VHVLHEHLLDGPVPALPRALEVDLLLRLPGVPLDGAADPGIGRDVGKAGDAVDGAGAQVQVRGPLLVAQAERDVGLGREALGDGDEGLRVLDRGAVVDVVGDEVGEDGLKVLVLAVVEGVEGFGALDVSNVMNVEGGVWGVGCVIFRGGRSVNIMVKR